MQLARGVQAGPALPWELGRLALCRSRTSCGPKRVGGWDGTRVSAERGPSSAGLMVCSCRQAVLGMLFPSHPTSCPASRARRHTFDPSGIRDRS